MDYLQKYKKHLFIGLAVILLMVVFSNMPKVAYNVKVNGEIVGNALTEEILNNIVAEIEMEENEKSKYIMKSKSQINLEQVSLEKKELNTIEDLKKALIENMEFVTIGYTIKVNNEEVMTLSNQDDINKLFKSIKGQYILENETIESASFLEKVTILKSDVKPESILTYEEAWEKFLKGKEEQETYIVKSGDTTWEIANNLNMSIDDIVLANPKADIINLQIGQEIITNIPKAIINVKTLTTEKVEEPIMNQVVYEKTGDLYVGESKLKQEGTNGKKIVELESTKVNGVLQNQTVLAEDIIEEPVNTILLSGTKWRQVASSGEFNKPTYGTLTSRFGPRWGRNHNGIDIGAPIGTEIRAADSGIVIQVGYINGYGKTVTLDHGDGLTTLYGHASAYKVSVGQSVKKDQVIALVGNTGSTTGPCLHFEVRINGVATDPLKYLQY